jgi:uncharacterized protein
MKFAVNQIEKFAKPYHFAYDFDLYNALVNKNDILAVKKCHVEGDIREPRHQEFLVSLDIDLELIMQCAVSLEEVFYPMHIVTDVVFSYDEVDDYYLIDKNTVNIDDAVLTEVLINLPLRVVKEEYQD